jgi:predicted TIM-barrel fold metal-dependent hydrolase
MEPGCARFSKGVISSDSHIIEPPDLWTSRIGSQWRDRCPRVERIDGNDWWIYDGQRIGSVSGRKRRSGGLPNGAVTSRGAVLTHSTFEDVDPAAYQPDLYVKANLQDGVVGVVIRPTQGITNYCIDDAALFSAVCRAYNDWIWEFCREAPAMLKAVAMLNDRDPVEAANELRRACARGMVGGMISVYPGREYAYSQPQYEVLWATAAELGVPLSLHVLSNRDGPYGSPFTQVSYSLRVNADYWARMSLADLIFSGVFERHPGLIIECSEHEGSWLPYFAWQMDWTWERRIRKRLQQNALPEPPSAYLRRHVYVSIIYDDVAIELRDRIGVDRMMWGSDFPHEQSTLPNSLNFLSALLSGVPDADAEAVTFGNAARLFGFDPTLLPAPLQAPAPALV